ncbi:hypothetical protein ACFXO2_11040 [Streptomyces sp. NPDC059152]|uniref:hypothetical protein n=1 Tax=Streptomyces sp. NPDC059152 TaxID=3346742 RepID=UPI00367744FA
MHVVHLVALDGFERYLDGATAPPGEGLRMVSLWSWTFESVYDTGIGFGDLAHNEYKRITESGGHVDFDPKPLVANLTKDAATLVVHQETLHMYYMR